MSEYDLYDLLNKLTGGLPDFLESGGGKVWETDAGVEHMGLYCADEMGTEDVGYLVLMLRDLDRRNADYLSQVDGINVTVDLFHDTAKFTTWCNGAKVTDADADMVGSLLLGRWHPSPSGARGGDA
ncbi:hypothetical protein [Thiohalocapsa marina]|uniref:hypothetical protein n=1 Tax=Thiohalocapsa marina TaxID=424902 RepID=UPI0036D8755C